MDKLAEQKQGIRNFVLNIQETMLKLKDGERLTKDEHKTIVAFYLEVADFIRK